MFISKKDNQIWIKIPKGVIQYVTKSRLTAVWFKDRCYLFVGLRLVKKEKYT